MGLTTALNKTGFLQQLDQFTEHVSQTLAQGRAQQFQLMQDRVVSSISDMFLQLPTTATETDVRNTMMKANDFAAATGTTQAALPIIQQSYKDRIDGLQRDEKRTEDQAYALAVSQATGTPITPGISGSAMEKIATLTKPILEKSDNAKGQLQLTNMKFTPNGYVASGPPIQIGQYGNAEKVALAGQEARARNIVSATSIYDAGQAKQSNLMTKTGQIIYMKGGAPQILTIDPKDNSQHWEPAPVFGNQPIISPDRLASRTAINDRLEAALQLKALGARVKNEQGLAEGIFKSLTDPDKKIIDPQTFSPNPTTGEVKDIRATLAAYLNTPAKYTKTIQGISDMYKDDPNSAEFLRKSIDSFKNYYNSSEEEAKQQLYKKGVADPVQDVAKATALKANGLTSSDYDTEGNKWSYHAFEQAFDDKATGTATEVTKYVWNNFKDANGKPIDVQSFDDWNNKLNYAQKAELIRVARDAVTGKRQGLNGSIITK